MVSQEKTDPYSLHSVEPNTFSRNDGMEARSEVWKIDKRAKLKVLPSEEVITLKSGTETATNITHGNLNCPPDVRASLCSSDKDSQIVGKTAIPKSFLPAEAATPLGLNAMQSGIALQQRAVWISNSNDDEDFPPGFPFKQSTLGKVPVSAGAGEIPGKKVARTANGGRVTFSISSGNKTQFESELSFILKDETQRDNVDGTTDLGLYLGQNKEEGMTFQREIQEGNLQRITPKVQKCPRNGPALKVIWKGTFEVFHVESDVKHCEGILAHLSAKVSPKAYRFSKQIAGVLQFKMHPRRDFWPEIFQTDYPDRDDIALYFYPGNYERSRHQYSSLLKFIEKQDMMLRSRMGLVELLVFPSRLLHVDFQKLDGSYFMWGVFRCSKGSTIASKAGALHSLPAVASNCGS